MRSGPLRMRPHGIIASGPIDTLYYCVDILGCIFGYGSDLVVEIVTGVSSILCGRRLGGRGSLGGKEAGKGGGGGVEPGGYMTVQP